MKGFLILSALLSVALARPSTVLQVSPLTSNLHAHASASAGTSLLPSQQLTLLRLLSNGPLDQDSQVIETAESNVDNAEHEVSAQRVHQANLLRDGPRNVLGLSPVLSATSSASALSSLSDGRVLDYSLEAGLNRAAAHQVASQRDEQLRLSGQSAQAQSQQQVTSGVVPGSLLSSTRFAHSLASLTPTGASSSSSVQIVESPELNAARAIQQQQALLLARESGGQLQRLLIGNDGQVVAAPLILL